MGEKKIKHQQYLIHTMDNQENAGGLNICILHCTLTAIVMLHIKQTIMEQNFLKTV